MEQSPDFYRGMIQAILAEEPCRDPIAREDAIFYRLGELADENAISEREATECWHQYISETRPDTKVIHLGQTVRGAFYE